MNTLDDYKNLLNEYDALINEVDWYLRREQLVWKMDKLWGRLTKTEQEECLNHGTSLFNKRVEKVA